MRICITGSSGFIGTHLVKKLRELNHELTLVDLKDGLDILNTQKMIELGQNQDCIIHLAAEISVPISNNYPLYYNQANIDRTLSMLESARINKIPRFIFASSAAVLKTNSVYAVTKLTGEYYCKLYSYLTGMKTICLRFFNVYGQGTDKGVIPTFLENIKNKKPLIIYGSGNQTRDFVYIDDVINAIILSLEYNDSGIFDVGSGTSITIKEIAELCYKLMRKKPNIKYKHGLKGDIYESHSNISRTIKQLGYHPSVDIEEGIKRMTECKKIIKRRV
jgi:UDP-glucose 4-epimerase